MSDANVPSQPPTTSTALDHTTQLTSTTEQLSSAPPVPEPPTTANTSEPPPSPSQAQPPSETTTSTPTTRETSTRSRVPTSTQIPTTVQTSTPSTAPETLQTPSSTDISVPLTSAPTTSTNPLQTSTVFPAAKPLTTTDPSAISAVAIVAIIFGVVAVAALLASFVCLVTRRAKRRKEYSIPRTSPPMPMTFKRDPPSVSPTVSPFQPTLPNTTDPPNSVPLSFRPSQKQHHPPPYLPNFGSTLLRPQLIPPSNASSYPKALSPNRFHHPAKYLPNNSVAAINNFDHTSTSSSSNRVPGWYVNQAPHGMTLPPNSPYEDYLALYNGDGALADAAYYSDYSAVAHAASEDRHPKTRLGESLFYQSENYRNIPETDPYHVSSKPVQGYDKPPNSDTGFPPIGGLSITNGYSSDVNSEDSDSSAGRYARLSSSGRDTATRSSLKNSPLSSSEQVGQIGRSEDRDSSTGRDAHLASSGRDTANPSNLGNSPLNPIGQIRRSEDRDSSTGRYARLASSGHAVGDTANPSNLSSEHVGQISRSENAEASSSTDTQKHEAPLGLESPRTYGQGHTKTFTLHDDQVDENTTGREARHGSTFFARGPSLKSEKNDPKLDKSGELSDGSAFYSSSEDEGSGPGGKGFYGGEKYHGRF